MPFLPPNQQRQSTEGNQGIIIRWEAQICLGEGLFSGEGVCWPVGKYCMLSIFLTVFGSRQQWCRRYCSNLLLLTACRWWKWSVSCVMWRVLWTSCWSVKVVDEHIITTASFRHSPIFHAGRGGVPSALQRCVTLILICLGGALSIVWDTLLPET